MTEPSRFSEAYQRSQDVHEARNRRAKIVLQKAQQITTWLYDGDVSHAEMARRLHVGKPWVIAVVKWLGYPPGKDGARTVL
jgi:predicted XRE-type DNA-binding protein